MHRRFLQGFLVFVVCASPTLAEVKLSGAFGDHMVLQRDMKVPVWGTAAPGERVEVSFAGQTLMTAPEPNGRWMVRLDPLIASEEPRTMTIKASNVVEVNDILIGDVWVASGQSNMELRPAQGLLDPEPKIAAANYPNIRMILMDKVVAEKPLTDLNGTWGACTPDTMKNFSAAAYFFGKQIHQTMKIPIGLIGMYYGGSNGVSWTRREVIEADPELRTQLANIPAPTTAPGVPLKPTTGGGVTSRYRPSNFYNGMVAPLIPFAIKGVIWYQGEADTANARQATQYATLFPAMIRDWRTQWGQGDFPFIFVQLPTSEPQYPDPTDSAWARVRESQQKATAVKNAAMVVTIDIGEGDVVHAHNKDKVGLRLAATALNKVYGKAEIPCEGPTFRSMDMKGGKVVLSFDGARGGLVSKTPGVIKGFAIAASDKKFVWADAKVDGNQVIVSQNNIAAPVAVRYAWADNPEISLFNQDGLPMAPFRTDDWPATQISNPRASP